MSILELVFAILTLVFSAGMGTGFFLLMNGTEKHRNRAEEMFLFGFIAGLASASLFGYMAFEELGSNRAVEALWAIGRGGIIFAFPMGISIMPGIFVITSKALAIAFGRTTR